MAGLTRDELAERAGVSVEFVERLVELSILTPGDGASPFSPGDVKRARFTRNLEHGGVPLKAVSAAMGAAS